MASIIGFLL